MKLWLIILALLIAPFCHAQCGITATASGVAALGNGTSGDTSCTLQANLYVQGLGSQIAAASTIAPTFAITHVTGASTINTITVPAHFTSGSIVLVPDTAFTWSASGNISVAGTATINTPVLFTYDGTKWNPSYTSTGGGGSGALTLIQKVTTSGSASSVTFSAIPQTYTHLHLVAQYQLSTSTSGNLQVNFNGDSTTAHYAWQIVYAAGTTATGLANNSTTKAVIGPGLGGDTCDIYNYSTAALGVNVTCSFGQLIIGTNPNAGVVAGFWNQTSAVTSFVLTDYDGGTFVNGSTFSLYGMQ